MKSVIIRFFCSGDYFREYLIGAFIAIAIASTLFYFEDSLYGGTFLWQASLGIFTGLVVGYFVDAVESLYRKRFVWMILSFLHQDNVIPIVIADMSIHTNDIQEKIVKEKIQELDNIITNSGEFNTSEALFRLHNTLTNYEPYRNTGPGESIAIGLFYGAYFALFSTGSKPVNSANIQVMSPEIDSRLINIDYTKQRFIFGGPKYNQLTRDLLKLPNIPIHYPEDEKGKYKGELHFKNNSNKKWPPTSNGSRDYGLIIRLNSQIHISGCRTWGVAGAAKCIFSESAAKLLVKKLRLSKIDPVSDNYFAVIHCEIPDQINHHYTIGDVGIDFVQKIQSN